MSLTLDIITPEKVVFRGEIDQLTTPTRQGYITILQDHVPLVTQIATGEITIKKGNNQHYIAIMGGFLELAKNTVTILTDYAVRSEEIEISKAEEAHKRAQKVMEEKISSEDMAIAQGEMRKAILELKVARKRKHHTTPSI